MPTPPTPPTRTRPTPLWLPPQFPSPAEHMALADGGGDAPLALRWVVGAEHRTQCPCRSRRPRARRRPARRAPCRMSCGSVPIRITLHYGRLYAPVHPLSSQSCHVRFREAGTQLPTPTWARTAPVLSVQRPPTSPRTPSHMHLKDAPPRDPEQLYRQMQVHSKSAQDYLSKSA